MSSKAKATLETELRTLVVGLGTLTGVDPLILAGKTYPMADLITTFNGFISAADAAAAAKTQYKAALAAMKAVRALVVSLRVLLRGFIVARYGKGSPELDKFGFGPTPRTPKVTTKVAAVAKAKATRTARGTAGKRQKKAIKGAPAPTPSPATPAPVAKAASTGSTQ